MELISEINHYDPFLAVLVTIWLGGILFLMLKIARDVFNKQFPTDTHYEDAQLFAERSPTIQHTPCCKKCKACKLNKENGIV